MNTKATARPWVVNPPLSAKATIPRSIHNLQYEEPLGRNNEICVMKDASFESDASAALIVKAVNRDHLFDEMVGIMEEIAEDMDSGWLLNSSKRGEKNYAKLLAKLQTVLAKIKEPTT